MQQLDRGSSVDHDGTARLGFHTTSLHTAILSQTSWASYCSTLDSSSSASTSRPPSPRRLRGTSK
eukprot:5401924-Pyramimonas_sp.AAC.1